MHLCSVNGQRAKSLTRPSALTQKASDHDGSIERVQISVEDPRGARCPLMAQMRSADRVQKCLLFGVDRTYRRQVLNDANDPQPTWRRRSLIRSIRRAV